MPVEASSRLMEGRWDSAVARTLPVVDRVDIGVDLRKAEGSVLHSSSGKDYIDMFMDVGVVSLGYVTAPQTVTHLPNYIAAPIREDAAAVLCSTSGMDWAFFSNSGTESVEAMMKFARKVSGRTGIYVPDTGQFHGRTYGAMSISYTAPYHREGFGPFLPDVGCFHDPEDIPEDAAAVILTPGMLNKDYRPYNKDWVKAIEAHCKAHGILLCVDEVQTYLRLGHWWGFQKYDLDPDLICVAKGVAAGLPTGATLGKAWMVDLIPKGSHFSSFGGNPASCAGILTVHHAASQPDFFQHLELVGALMEERILAVAPDATIRRDGAMLAADLDVDMVALRDECLKRGVIIGVFGQGALKLTPALNIELSTLREAMLRLEAAYVAVRGRD